VIARTPRPVRRVLAAVDGSAHAQRALEVVAGAPWADAIDVVEIVTVGNDEAAAEATLAAAARALPGLPVVTRRLPGSASTAQAILDAAGPEVDLIVVGTRGVGALERLLAGSTATAVAERAECCVLLAHVDHADQG
jgi:nucleotide-binding universal stress UspA family protein